METKRLSVCGQREGPLPDSGEADPAGGHPGERDCHPGGLHRGGHVSGLKPWPLPCQKSCEHTPGKERPF